MYKVLLVDDEPNVRKGIRMMIPWSSLNCEIIDEAEDGDDGLKKIITLSPDIVIADIKMPGRTGLEMTATAKDMGFKGKVLILSGYSDFTYAKNAISLGVENFILKPVDEDELIEAIKNCTQKIADEKENTYQQQKGNEYLNEQLLRGLFSGDENAISMAEGKMNYVCYTSCIISANNTDTYETVRSFFKSITNIDLISLDISGVLGILFKGWVDTEIVQILKRLYASMESKIFVAIGSTVYKPSDICHSYASANDIFSLLFVYKHIGVVTAVDYNKTMLEPITDDFASSIYAYIEINDIQKLNKMIDSFMESIILNKLTAESAKIKCITLLIDLRAKINKATSYDKKSNNSITDELITELGEATSLYSIIERIREVLIDTSNTDFSKTTKSTIERIVRYIDLNYASDLKLESLASIFGYNSAYLGKAFHRFTGDNFNNYLDSIRIAEAKRLLQGEKYKVYEVAEMVGYSNINYFHNKFKKHVGVSPLAYKKAKGDISTIKADDDEEE